MNVPQAKRERNSGLSVGFIGYVRNDFDHAEARRLIHQALGIIAGSLGYIGTIVSGTTSDGIPGLVYRIADAHGYPTVGVACALIHAQPKHPVCEEIVVGANWGEESDAFIGMLDVLVRIGGGPQSDREMRMAWEAGIIVLAFPLPLLGGA